MLYARIPDAKKENFINKNGTKKKLDYCREIGLDISETYYLPGIIYNTPLHSTTDQDISNPLAVILENYTIKKWINEVFKGVFEEDTNAKAIHETLPTN